MTKVKCKYVFCKNRIQKHTQKKYCSDICGARQQTLKKRVKKMVAQGISDPLICVKLSLTNWQLRKIIELKLANNIVTIMSFDTDKRYPSEKYLLETKRFYLRESDRLPPIPQDGKTIGDLH